jgi:glycosyltransferase involved in cell wall biosynthesis
MAAELLVQVPGSRCDHETEIDGVPVHYVAAPDKFRSASLFQFDARRLARRAKDFGPDIVHAHGTEDAYSLAAQDTGLASVITVQGLYFLINRKVKPRLISRAKAVQFTEWLALKRARHVITKSDYVAQQLKARFPHLILHAIPNTFDERLLHIHEQKRRNSLVFVGTISPWKGVHTLRQALIKVRSEVPEIALDIAGDSTNSALPYETEQKQLLKDALGNQVRFHGQLDVIELGHLVASSVALIAPSLEEMFGNQLVEALLLGTHGIVAEGTALAEHVCRFGGGTIVPQENHQALAHAILATLRNRAAANTAEVRKRIVEHMGPEVVARQHHSLYQQLL